MTYRDHLCLPECLKECLYLSFGLGIHHRHRGRYHDGRGGSLCAAGRALRWTTAKCIESRQVIVRTLSEVSSEKMFVWTCSNLDFD